VTHLCRSSSDPVELPLSEVEEMNAGLEGESVDGFEIEVEKVVGRKNTR
jgi:hypothetical protein